MSEQDERAAEMLCEDTLEEDGSVYRCELKSGHTGQPHTNGVWEWWTTEADLQEPAASLKPTKRQIKNVRLLRRVESDLPFGPKHFAEPGIHEAFVNPHGAVSVIDNMGELLGVKPGEFEWVREASSEPAPARDRSDKNYAIEHGSFQHHVLCSCPPTTEIGSRGCMCRIEYGASLESEAIEALRRVCLAIRALSLRATGGNWCEVNDATVAAEAVLAKYDSRQVGESKKGAGQ